MDLYKFAVRLVQQKRLVMATFTSVMVVALLLCFGLPRKYSSTVVILPKTSPDQLLLSRLSPGLGLQSRMDWIIPKVIESEAYLLPVIKQRFEIQDSEGQRIVSLADLMGRPDRARLLKRAADYIHVTTDDRDGSIRVRVVTPYPELSYKVAAKMLASLDAFIDKERRELQANYDGYYRSRIEEAKNELALAELELITYLDKNRAWLESDDPRENLELNRFKRKQTIYMDVYKEVRKQRELDDIKSLALIPPVDVLDFPEIPTIKSSPRRKIIMIGGFAAAMILSLLILAAGEQLSRTRLA